jgi:hypothetical protein
MLALSPVVLMVANSPEVRMYAISPVVVIEPKSPIVRIYAVAPLTVIEPKEFTDPVNEGEASGALSVANSLIAACTLVAAMLPAGVLEISTALPPPCSTQSTGLTRTHS